MSCSSFLSFEIFDAAAPTVSPRVSASRSLMIRFSSARESAES